MNNRLWNHGIKTGANLFLSYRFAPVLYRYGLSTVYNKLVGTEINNSVFLTLL